MAPLARAADQAARRLSHLGGRPSHRERRAAPPAAQHPLTAQHHPPRIDRHPLPIGHQRGHRPSLCTCRA
eukprot:3634501-Prymnesium_polylepis.1